MSSEIDLPDRPSVSPAAAVPPPGTGRAIGAGRDTLGTDAERRGPLTHEQRERWLAWRFAPAHAPARVDHWVVTFDEPVNRAALEGAVAAVVDRHPILRTVYAGDGTEQEVLAAERDGARMVGDAPAVADGGSLAEWLGRDITARLQSGTSAPVGWWLESHSANARLILAAHALALDARSALHILSDVLIGYAVRTGHDIGADPAGWVRDGSLIALARAQAARALDENASVAREYWRHKLADIPGPLELPIDKPRPPTPSCRGGRVRHVLPAEVAEATRICADQLGVSFGDVMIAGFAALLHRLSGSTDFILGLALDEDAGVAGPTRCMRPVRVRCESRHSFSTLVEAIAREHAEGVAFIDADLGGIVRQMYRHRDPARPWLSAGSIEFQDLPEELPCGMARLPVAHEQSEHLDGDFAVVVGRTAGSVVLELQYNIDVFAGETARRWAGHYAALLASAVVAPERAIAQLALLTAVERNEILVSRNPAVIPVLDGPPLLHRAFEASALQRPEHPAVMVDGDEVSFSGLNARANRLARQLLALGAGPERCIALVLDRSVDYAEATLGVLKSGAAFVPIDPEWPAERQELVIRDCGAGVVITAGRPVPGALAAGVRVLNLRESAAALAAYSADAPDVEVRPEHLAYLIYTSGSTGQPKGVMIDHRAAAVHMASIARVYRIAPDDRSLLFHSVAFDPAIEQLFAPWVVGATVYIRGDHLWNGREFSEWVRRERITAVTLPPLYWLQLLRDWEQQPALAPLGQLRRVLVGGEALPPTVVELWRRLGLTSIRLLNGYGPTECTVTATVHELPAEPAAHEASGRVAIGRPQGPVEAYVLDADLQPQPIGVPGELCLAGPTVARGYLGREALTRERFVPHPFGREGRMYRTGDQARLLADGTIDFCGRADRQVKVGGYRVEPGEIEALLGRLDGVHACAVVVETESSGVATLVGYIVPSGEEHVSEAALREALAESLPRYMVPSRVFAVRELPRTINGKLDARALAHLGMEIRAREAQAIGDEDARKLPVERDSLEARVATIWGAVLNRPDPRLSDDFFACGGHSLLAVDLFARIEREFGIHLALSDWLAEPSFGALVRLVRARTSGANETEQAASWRFLFPIHAGGTRPRLFLFAGGRGCDEDFVVLAALTRALGPDLPVWGARVGGPDRLTATHRRTEEMARDVAREIRAFQPEGPYHLAGECIGGLLAFEVARVLEREGAAVQFLGLINTGCPRVAEPFRWWISTSWVGRAKQTLGPLLRVLRGAPLREAPRHVAAAAAKVMRPPHSGRAARSDGMPEDPKDYFYGHLLLRYKPTPTRIPVVIFGCETYKRAANLKRWSRHASVRLAPLRGNSTTCIREYAADSAERLRTELDATAQPAAG